MRKIHGEQTLLVWSICIVFILVFFWPSHGHAQEGRDRLVIGEEYGDVFFSTGRSIADLDDIEAAGRSKEARVWGMKVKAGLCVTRTWKRIRYQRVVSTLRGHDDSGLPAELFLAEVEVQEHLGGPWEKRYTMSSVPIVGGQPVIEF